ncbi:hypothetical protein AB0M71_50085, partial [Amycolatopsis sp. NPDC051114]|uniref:hypothetical protein n=1 Tax=Amycolatopsis sp. NPDC051114 TaxID=3155280 RepID=UPI00342AC001
MVTAHGGAGGGAVVVGGAEVVARTSGAGSAIGLGVVVGGAAHDALSLAHPRPVRTPARAQRYATRGHTSEQ